MHLMKKQNVVGIWREAERPKSFDLISHFHYHINPSNVIIRQKVALVFSPCCYD